jgi:hypothetical protein
MQADLVHPHLSMHHQRVFGAEPEERIGHQRRAGAIGDADHLVVTSISSANEPPVGVV